MIAALDVADPAGIHARRQTAATRPRRGNTRKLPVVGAGDLAPLDTPTDLAPTHDVALRAKLQRQYLKLTKRQGHPATRLPTLPDVQCLEGLVANVPDGRARLIQFIQGCMLDHDEQATAWWTVYADLTSAERNVVNLDEIGLAAGVPYSDLVGTVMSFAARYGAALGDFTFKLLTVDAVVESAKNAKLPAEAGFPDREMFLKGAGLVPSPRGQTTQVTVQAVAQAAAGAGSGRLRFLEDVAEAGAAREVVQAQVVEDLETPAADKSTP